MSQAQSIPPSWSSVGRNLLKWALYSEVSTRSSALIRIFLVCVIWSQWGISSLLLRHPGWSWVVFCAVFFGSTTFFLFGLFTRLAGFAVAASVLTIIFVHGHFAGRYVHHFELAIVPFVIYTAFLPAGGSWSLDRWWRCRQARQRGQVPPRERGNVWALRLISLHLAAIYIWTAIEKFNPAFLSGVKLQEYLLQYYVADLPDSLVLEWVCKLVSWGTIVLEFALAFGLFYAPARKWLVPLGLLLHGLFYVLLPVQIYSALMWVGYLSYLDPDAMHRFFDSMMDPREESGELAKGC